MPKTAYSIWTIPRTSWDESTELEAVEVSTEATERVSKAIQDAKDSRDNQDRIRPFETPINIETLSKAVS